MDIKSQVKVEPFNRICAVPLNVAARAKKLAVRAAYDVIARLIDGCSSPVNQGVRRHFNERFNVAHKASKIAGHSHPIAAKTRSSASRAIDAWALELGMDVYTVSRSARDEELGQRLFYHTKDLAMTSQNDQIPQNAIIKMVDVDYYADMEYWIGHGRPVVLYTFVPNRAGGSALDATFSVEDDHIRMKVNGGAEYYHQLWDYNHDWITVPTMCGVWVCSVDQVMTGDPQRRIVCIVPRRWVPAPLSWLVARCDLKRMKMSHGSVNVMRHLNVDGKAMISMSARGVNSSVLVRDDLFRSIVIRFQSSRYKNISDIERYLIQEKVDRPYVPASLLYQLLTQNIDYTVESSVTVYCGSRPTDNHYQAVNGLVTEDGRYYARRLAIPIVEGDAVVPVESFNNDLASITGRVEMVRNDKVPPSRFYQFSREFVLRLVGASRLAPYDVSRIVEVQSKPMQRMRSMIALLWLGCKQFVVRAFGKREAYSHVVDPRNISGVPTDHTLRLSSFTHALKDNILKFCPWYMPCRSPADISEVVMTMAAQHQQLVSIDFSRLDGTISEWLRRQVEGAVYNRAFGFSEELDNLLRNELNPRAVTKMGVRYQPGSSRLSGSPLTTDGNTMITAFVAYASLRFQNYSVDEAFTGLGCAYGDDLLTIGDPDVFAQTARYLGLSVKVQVSRIGQPVNYLSRIFIDPWTTNTSLQDVRRTLAKLHLTVTTENEVPLEVATLNKMRGYLVIDPITPIISNYCKAVLRCIGDDQTICVEAYEACRKDLPWFATQTGAWIQNSLDLPLMFEVVARELDISVVEVYEICERLNEVKQLEEIPYGIIQLNREVRIPAVVDGQVVEVDGPAVTQPVVVERQQLDVVDGKIVDERRLLELREKRRLKKIQQRKRRQQEKALAAAVPGPSTELNVGAREFVPGTDEMTLIELV